MFVLYLVKTSDASERIQRRRPFLVCLLIEPEYRTLFESLFKLLTLQPLSENSRVNLLPPKHEICTNFLSKCELQRRLIAALSVLVCISVSSVRQSTMWRGRLRPCVRTDGRDFKHLLG